MKWSTVGIYALAGAALLAVFVGWRSGLVSNAGGPGGRGGTILPSGAAADPGGASGAGAVRVGSWAVPALGGEVLGRVEFDAMRALLGRAHEGDLTASAEQVEAALLAVAESLLARGDVAGWADVLDLVLVGRYQRGDDEVRLAAARDLIRLARHDDAPVELRARAYRLAGQTVLYDPTGRSVGEFIDRAGVRLAIDLLEEQQALGGVGGELDRLPMQSRGELLIGAQQLGNLYGFAGRDADAVAMLEAAVDASAGIPFDDLRGRLMLDAARAAERVGLVDDADRLYSRFFAEGLDTTVEPRMRVAIRRMWIEAIGESVGPLGTGHRLIELWERTRGEPHAESLAVARQAAAHFQQGSDIARAIETLDQAEAEGLAIVESMRDRGVEPSSEELVWHHIAQIRVNRFVYAAYLPSGPVVDVRIAEDRLLPWALTILEEHPEHEQAGLVRRWVEANGQR